MTATPATLTDDLSELEPHTLLDDAEAFETALDASAGPIAVVGEPFAGRRRLLDHAEQALDATRTRFEPSADGETLRDDLGDGPLIIDDCQHLYDRRIGGFEPLTAFLDALAGRSAPVVTGWNAYAWSYLDAVRDVEDVFADRFSVRELPREELASVVRSASSPSLPTFRHDERDDVITMRERSVRGGNLTVPVPVVDRDRLRAIFETTDDPETAVFERLTSASDGNPGVALALWERSQRNGEIRPSDIDPPAIDLDHAGAFLLRIVLSEGVVDTATLTERFGPRGRRALGRLDRAGIVTRTEGSVRLEPAGVPAAAALTERRRLL
jgi:hypothetical protein